MFWRSFLSMCCLVLAVGCGHRGDRNALRGTVTLDDESLPSGVIEFVPLPGTNGPSAGAEIMGGTFFVDADQGVLPGSFRVAINSFRKTGRTRQNIAGEQAEVVHDAIPAKYNDASELIANVELDRENTFDFVLTSN